MYHHSQESDDTDSRPTSNCSNSIDIEVRLQVNDHDSDSGTRRRVSSKKYPGSRIEEEFGSTKVEGTSTGPNKVNRGVFRTGGGRAKTDGRVKGGPSLDGDTNVRILDGTDVTEIVQALQQQYTAAHAKRDGLTITELIRKQKELMEQYNISEDCFPIFKYLNEQETRIVETDTSIWRNQRSNTSEIPSTYSNQSTQYVATLAKPNPHPQSQSQPHFPLQEELLALQRLSTQEQQGIPWHKFLYDQLGRISEHIGRFYQSYKLGAGKLPGEETITDILVWGLGRNGAGFHVSLTSKRTEGKEGHDLVLRLKLSFDNRSSATDVWVCYLQAKKINKEVADFAYRHQKKKKKQAVNRQNQQGEKSEEETILSRQFGYDEKQDDFYDSESECDPVTEQEVDQKKAQVDLLKDKVEKETKRAKQFGSKLLVTGGYIVYYREGVAYFPIDVVKNAYTLASTTMTSKDAISLEMTKVLFNSGKDILLQSMLPTLDEFNKLECFYGMRN